MNWSKSFPMKYSNRRLWVSKLNSFSDLSSSKKKKEPKHFNHLNIMCCHRNLSSIPFSITLIHYTFRIIIALEFYKVGREKPFDKKISIYTQRKSLEDILLFSTRTPLRIHNEFIPKIEFLLFFSDYLVHSVKSFVKMVQKFLSP